MGLFKELLNSLLFCNLFVYARFVSSNAEVKVEGR